MVFAEHLRPEMKPVAARGNRSRVIQPWPAAGEQRYTADRTLVVARLLLRDTAYRVA